MTDQVCDPETGVCALPASSKDSNPANSSPESGHPLTNLAIFKEVDVTTLVTDKGDSIALSSIPSSSLVLLYFSAVPPFPLILDSIPLRLEPH
jgi:hypothetical protein